MEDWILHYQIKNLQLKVLCYHKLSIPNQNSNNLGRYLPKDWQQLKSGLIAFIVTINSYFLFLDSRFRNMAWSDNHRYFMQYIISHRIIEKTEMEKIHHKIFGEEETLQRTLDDIDTRIPKIGNLELVFLMYINEIGNQF